MEFQTVAEFDVHVGPTHPGVTILHLTIEAASKAMRKPAHLRHYTVKCRECGWRERVSSRADGHARAKAHAKGYYHTIDLDC